MKGWLWVGLVVVVSLSDRIDSAETPAGSQYDNLKDTTETAGVGEQLVSHRDIRVMLSLSHHFAGLISVLLSSPSSREFWASGVESSVWASSSY